MSKSKHNKQVVHRDGLNKCSSCFLTTLYIYCHKKCVSHNDRLSVWVDAMRCDPKITLLTLISNVFTEQQPGICSYSSQGWVNCILFYFYFFRFVWSCGEQFYSCIKSRNPLECCRNYKLVGNTCQGNALEICILT